MCVIIVKQQQQQTPTDVIKTSARINPDGLGVVWLDTYEITYHKSSEYMVLDTTRPFIAHFRYATIGKVGRSNTHPFQCGPNSNEYLMMNGHIHGLGNADKCDSKVLAEALGKVPRHEWKSELAKHKMVRFLSVNVRNRQFQMYNKELWTFRDGIWYSKANVIEEHNVAVYGTLKRGHGNYERFLSDSKFLGDGVTKDRYPLVINSLPYVLNKKGLGHNVEVDVFRVSGDVLAQLDILEGHPKWYERKQIAISMADGTIKFAWLYFNPIAVSSHTEFHKTYKGHSKPQSGYKPQKFGMTSQRRMWADETPYCTSCYHDLKKIGSFYECKGCSEIYTYAEVDRLYY